MSFTVNIILIIILALLIILSSFFSAAETAYSSVSQSKIDLDFKKGKKSAILINKHYKSFGWTLSTILICNNIVNISSSALITYMFTKILGGSESIPIISTAIMTPIIVIFGEIMPKILAKKYSYKYLKKICYVIEFLNLFLLPITYPLSKITLQSKITNSESELKNLILIAKKEGVIEPEEAKLASRALDIDSTKVGAIMTKKQEIISINEKSFISEALKLFKKSGHSRIIVKNKKEFKGMIMLKDLFYQDHKNVVEKHMIEIPSVSQHVLASKAMEIMRKNKVHILLVTHNQSIERVVGIITIEDIIEELVGEIYDEHDDNLNIQEIAHYKWKVLGSTNIEEFQKETNISLENVEDLRTIKQWIQKRINRKIKRDIVYVYKEKVKFKIISNKNKEETIIEVIKK